MCVSGQVYERLLFHVCCLQIVVCTLPVVEQHVHLLLSVRAAAESYQFMEILKVCHEKGLAPPSLLSANTILEFDGLEGNYYTFPWDEFFELVWPKVRRP